jgi:transposase-like protein
MAHEGNQFALGNNGGRPTKYNADYHNEAVFGFCLLGATDKRIAELFGINQSTLDDWKIKYPEFSLSIQKGKDEADMNVAKSLYKRATGFEYTETTYERIVGDTNEDEDAEDEQQMWKKKVVKRIQVPDVTAQSLWLKNRRRKSRIQEGEMHWSDKQETGLTDVDGNDLINSPIKFE